MDPLFLIAVVQFGAPGHFLERWNSPFCLVHTQSLIDEAIVTKSVFGGQLVELMPVGPESCSPSPRVIEV